MPCVLPDTNIEQCQSFVKEVYGKPNDRFFGISDLLCNIQRFGMRGLKGIRKGDIEKTKTNLMISFSWFLSLLNRVYIDLENEIWKRFPYLCSYCGDCPCTCKSQHLDERKDIPVDESKRPKKLSEFQKMFNEIYPASSRTIADAGVHFAEEIGELSETILAYRSERTKEDFKKFGIEVADYFSCYLGIFNSLGLDFAEELAKFWANNCHECHDAPCSCSYSKIKTYKS